MKLFFFFSLTLCPHLPKCLFFAVLLSIALSPSVWHSPSPFVFMCPFHICSLVFHLDDSFCSLPITPLCSHLLQVDYRTEDGTANAGSDYEFAEGTLLFKPGETLKGKKTTLTTIISDIFSINMSLKLMLK